MSLENKLADVMFHIKKDELALGYLRYDVLRKFSPHQYSNFWRKAMGSDKSFDTLVDELIGKEGK